MSECSCRSHCHPSYWIREAELPSAMLTSSTQESGKRFGTATSVPQLGFPCQVRIRIHRRVIDERHQSLRLDDDKGIQPFALMTMLITSTVDIIDAYVYSRGAKCFGSGCRNTSPPKSISSLSSPGSKFKIET